MPVYQIDGLTPVVPDESYVHPTAVQVTCHAGAGFRVASQGTHLSLQFGSGGCTFS